MVAIRRSVVAVATVLAAALFVTGQAAAATRQEVTITSTDATRLAATLTLPDGAPPTGGWPAVVILHGLGGDRSSSLALADSMGLGGAFAVLAYDARGHGQSGGLIGIDGPRETADVRAVFDWLRARPDVSDTRIGGFGTSYGGGALWNSLAAGTPWATIVANITWVDLRSALLPQNLVKSGIVAGFLGSLPAAKVDPEVLAIRDAAYAGDLSRVAPWAAARSSFAALAGNRTPVFMLQGRRDFAFGIDQATRAWAQLAGPKRLWLGLHGHAPSSFPAADSTAMLAEASLWLFTQLGIPTVAPLRGLDPRPIAIAPENWSGGPARSATLPAVTRSTFALPGSRSITARSAVQRSTKPLARPLEVFGAPVVKVTATAAGGWSRLVAILAARTPAGKEIVVAGGAVPTRAGRRTYSIVLSNQATFLPKGSRLTLTLGSSSLAQNAGNLLYLDLPMATGARISVGAATLVVPGLKQPVSR